MKRAIIRRRRSFWLMLVFLFVLLFRFAIDNDGMRCALAGLMILCWIAIYREWVYGGLR